MRIWNLLNIIRPIIICRITCPGFYNKYIEKTDRNIIARMDEHGIKPEEPMYQHLANCAQFAEYLEFYALRDIDAQWCRSHAQCCCWKYRNYWLQ